MFAADHETAPAAGDSEPPRGTPAPSPWDPAPAVRLSRAGRAVMTDLSGNIFGDTWSLVLFVTVRLSVLTDGGGPGTGRSCPLPDGALGDWGDL